MGFKLGSERGLQASRGEIRNKFRFHQESGDPDLSVTGTPVIRKDLGPEILGEANMDGTIYISNTFKPGSFEERQTVSHEMRHATDIKIGKLSYADDHVMWNGEKFERATINGMDMINVYGEWMEAGDGNFPWEKEANNGNSMI